MKIKEGEKIPNSKVFILSKDGPKEISIGEIIGQDKVILFGYQVHLPQPVQQNIFQDLLILWMRLKKRALKKLFVFL
jgi:hypothetical protein